MKWFRVVWHVGPPAFKKVEYRDVELPYPENAPLRPAMARAAARLAINQDHGVTVWAADSYGYALYPGSQDKVRRAFNWDYEGEEAHAAVSGPDTDAGATEV